MNVSFVVGCSVVCDRAWSSAGAFWPADDYFFKRFDAADDFHQLGRDLALAGAVVLSC